MLHSLFYMWICQYWNKNKRYYGTSINWSLYGSFWEDQIYRLSKIKDAWVLEGFCIRSLNYYFYSGWCYGRYQSLKQSLISFPYYDRWNYQTYHFVFLHDCCKIYFNFCLYAKTSKWRVRFDMERSLRFDLRRLKRRNRNCFYINFSIQLSRPNQM